MSSIHLDMDRTKKSEIKHYEIFSTQMGELCMSKEFSDVLFEVQDEKIPGHVNILATRSRYFRALLCAGFAESNQRVIKLDVPIEAFKALLKYIYSGHLSLSKMREDYIFDTLNLVHQCGCTELEQSISEYLCDVITLDNVWTIVNIAKVLGLENLKNVSLIFFDDNATDALDHESFKNLTEEILKSIISRDTFLASEFQIFTAVSNWCKHNSNATESVVSLVRLPLLGFDELFECVRFSGVFDPNSLLDAIKQKTTSTSLPYRKRSRTEENIATEKIGARVIQGDCGSALLDGDTTSYNLDKGYAYHKITDNLDSGIIVDLGLTTLINHLKLLLLDSDERSYSYYVDISIDKTQWERVVDHQAYRCRSRQFLYFPTRAVRYIKLVGTLNSKKEMFEVVSLEAYCTAELPEMINGILAPTENVATMEMGATVVPDDNVKLPGILLNGDKKENDNLFQHTSRLIDDGSIMIQLGQPYVIGSMRLLLFNDTGWPVELSYYIETSIDKNNWEVLVTNEIEDCRSWQDLEFEPRTMVFIKIVGTSSNVLYMGNNPIFACSHFECPAQEHDEDDESQEGANEILEDLEHFHI